MPRKDFNKRYELIIKRLESSPATYIELKNYLLNSEEFKRIEQYSYSIRTLQRDIADINSKFDFEIHNKKRDPRYYIREKAS